MKGTISMEDQLINYFKEQLGAEVSESTELIEEGIIDSMGVVDMLTYISETFNVEFDMEDMVIDNFKTIATIASFVNSKR